MKKFVHGNLATCWLVYFDYLVYRYLERNTQLRQPSSFWWKHTRRMGFSHSGGVTQLRWRGSSPMPPSSSPRTSSGSGSFKLTQESILPREYFHQSNLTPHSTHSDSSPFSYRRFLLYRHSLFARRYWDLEM